MAYTIEQYNSLTEAIASGTLTVSYADKHVTYRSLSEMLQIQGAIETALGLNASKARRKLASYSKGIYPQCTE